MKRASVRVRIPIPPPLWRDSQHFRRSFSFRVHQGVAQPEERQSGGLEAAGAGPATLTVVAGSAVQVTGYFVVQWYDSGITLHPHLVRFQARARARSCDRSSSLPILPRVAQSRRAPALGAGGRRGGSCRADSCNVLVIAEVSETGRSHKPAPAGATPASATHHISV